MSKKPTAAPERSRSRWVRFTAPFDYTWPSRAMTSYLPGFEGRVKGEVADAAVPAYAEEIPAPAESGDSLDKPKISK